MASRPGTNPYEARALGALRAILAERRGVEERRMFGHPAFFVKGRMFACLYGQAVALKLSAARATALLARTDCAPFRPHGKSMRHWIEIRRGRGADFRHEAESVLAAMRFVSRQAAPGAKR